MVHGIGAVSELSHDPDAVAAALGIAWTDARQRVLTRIAEYVAQETPSAHPELLDPLAMRVADDLRAAGATVRGHAAAGLGTNLVADVAGQEDAPPVLLLAHIDTVHPVGAFGDGAMRLEDGRAYGPGVYDMKGGAALLVEALTRLRERGRQPRRPVRFLVTCDEEIGSHSSRALIETHARTAGAVLVPEPCMPDGGVKTGRKGVATYRLETTGDAAHAGIDPGAGISASHELARQMLDAFALADHARGTTINIGMIGAGTATNVIPGSAWATIDVRLADLAEGDRVHDALSRLHVYDARAGVTAQRTEYRPPLVRTPAVVALYQHAHELAKELGFDLGEGSTGGGSDGSIAAAEGAAVLDGLGPRGAGAHTLHEHILIDDLPLRLALLCRLLETL
ncbi:MAG: M20/M25/M40 family metallo-hydrolase [Longimicrobiales bacterium]